MHEATWMYVSVILPAYLLHRYGLRIKRYGCIVHVARFKHHHSLYYRHINIVLCTTVSSHRISECILQANPCRASESRLDWIRLLCCYRAYCRDLPLFQHYTCKWRRDSRVPSLSTFIHSYTARYCMAAPLGKGVYPFHINNTSLLFVMYPWVVVCL